MPPSPDQTGHSQPNSVARLAISRRFAPLLITQTLTSFIDNLTKSASGVLMLFTLPDNGPSLLALGGGIFMLPYVLGSSLAGEIADRFEKAWLLRVLQLTALGLALCGGVALLTQNVAAQLLTLLGLGAQAAFFGPVKYGIIPELLNDCDLVAGNGLVEAGTFLGIVSGTTVGSMLVLAPHGTLAVGLLAAAVALGAVGSAFAVLRGQAAAPALRIRANIAASSADLVATAFRVRPIRLSVLWLSWFWALGLVVLSELPVVAKDLLNGSEATVTLLLTVFSLGVGAGSLLCAHLLHGDVSARHVPAAGLGLTVFIADFALAAHRLGATGAAHLPADLLATPGGLRLLFDLLMLAVCGGIYSVPLNAMLQARAEPQARSRMVAANNAVNAVCMVIAALAVAELARRGVAATAILWGSAAVNLLVTCSTVRFAWSEPRHRARS